MFDGKQTTEGPTRILLDAVARVSVIDDSSDFLDVMRDLLESLGHHMTGFKAVETSIDSVVDSQPELLIVDLRLEDKPQEISGWELIVLARAHRHLVDVPLIPISSTGTICNSWSRKWDRGR